ncbi:hypothetical protein [Candidatus Nitrosopumilus sediminis]|uniref:SpoVT-AbrB domain-containing protein n=1 Tax=Candidatus Nitrosopumilus sediminis TaxID=1229909 RepID=K0BBW8_9ARCH|nr:hypothetical protein [Candidatus Nitrosopumilus sediminis]AFS82627.1 hypothetical protein NSED_04105 [Candidatus Nitrosopumilus sediminis]
MESKIKSKTRPEESIETDFGQRQVSHQNFSRIVALPKIALQNCGITSQVSVKLVLQNGEKFLKITPAKTKGGEKTE